MLTEKAIPGPYFLPLDGNSSEQGGEDREIHIALNKYEVRCTREEKKS